MSVDHARHRLDNLLLNPVRLSIVASLASVEEAEFALVRDTVEISDSVLSRQVVALHPYVLMRKGYVGKRPRSWLRLSRQGRKAYELHLEALREIAGD